MVCSSGSRLSSHWRPKPELNARFNFADSWNISCNLSRGRAKQPHQPAFKTLPGLIPYELLALSKGDDAKNETPQYSAAIVCQLSQLVSLKMHVLLCLSKLLDHLFGS